MVEYRIDKTGAGGMVACAGRLTFSDAGAFQRIADEIKLGAGKKWVLDFSRLDFIDSAGLGMLLIALEIVSDQRTALSIRGAQGQVRKALDLAKFHELIPLEA